MNAIDQFLQRLQSLSSGAYLPTVYDGFVEADALVESEDSILDLLRGYVHELWLNRNMLSMTEEKLALFEEKLKLSITASMTAADRREAVANAVNEHYVMNDSALLALIQSLSGGATNDFSIDAQNLILQFEKMTNTQGEHEADELKKALETAQPVIPMNLATKLAVLAENELTVTAGYGWTTATSSNLGDVEYVRPPTTLYNVMDISAGTEAQCREPPKMQTIDKGGTMFEGDRDIVLITEQGINVMDKTPDGV